MQGSVNYKKRTWLKVVWIILGVFALLVVAILGFALLGKGSTESLKLSGATAAALEDGVYSGSYDAFRWSNAVEVTVKDHRIESIRVTKPQVVAKPETIEALTSRVLQSQSTEVDTVSSATIDSKAFLKAVENALTPAT